MRRDSRMQGTVPLALLLLTLLSLNSRIFVASQSSLPTTIGSILQISFLNENQISIPGVYNESDGAANPYPSQISVAGTTGSIIKATVTLKNFSHTWPGDLDVLLVGPTGASVMLMSRVGSELSIVNISMTFDDSSAYVLNGTSQIPNNGTFRPTGLQSNYPAMPAPAGPYGSTLSTFNGLSANGVWSLYVFDHEALM